MDAHTYSKALVYLPPNYCVQLFARVSYQHSALEYMLHDFKAIALVGNLPIEIIGPQSFTCNL